MPLNRTMPDRKMPWILAKAMPASRMVFQDRSKVAVSSLP